MRTIDTRGQNLYSPLIPAIKAMCEAGKGEKLEIIMDDATAFNDLKEYLAEQGIGFREIYDGEEMVGYVMVIYDYDIPEYDIWHMMIDASKQGEGYGSTALKQVMEYIFYRPHINRCLARKYSEKVPNKFGEKYGTDKIAILSC